MARLTANRRFFRLTSSRQGDGKRWWSNLTGNHVELVFEATGTIITGLYSDNKGIAASTTRNPINRFLSSAASADRLPSRR